MSEAAWGTVTIVERTINSQKVIAFVCGDEGEGDALVESAERQDAHSGISSIDRIHVLERSLLPDDSLFTLDAGAIYNAGRFVLSELGVVAACMRRRAATDQP